MYLQLGPETMQEPLLKREYCCVVVSRIQIFSDNFFWQTFPFSAIMKTFYLYFFRFSHLIRLCLVVYWLDTRSPSSHKVSILTSYFIHSLFLTAILHRGVRNCFFLFRSFTSIFFLDFIFLFYLDFYFPILF